MTDISQNPEGNLPEYSVSELSSALKRTVEESYSYVRVRGEISGFKRAASGHLYMSLKDESAVLDAVCWRGTAGRLSLQPEDGLEVVATGKITTYAQRSRYQIVIESLEVAGEGALLKLLEDRRRKLAEEGLFDEDRKRELPYLPEVIGVVTSPTGAVIRDILHRLADRFPRRILLWPVLVQGEVAAEQVAAAIEGFNDLAPGGAVPRPDLLIVARGGGSLEDLWAFNEEIVVRAAASSEIPLIAAIGHETDWTLIDHAADVRAPTPTAAAEIAVPVRADLLAALMDDGRRMVAAMARLIADRRLRIEGLGRGLPDLDSLIGNQSQRLDSTVERLVNAKNVRLDRSRGQVAALSGRLRSPEQIVRTSGERVAREVAALKIAFGRCWDDAGKRLGHLGELLESISPLRVLDRGYVLVEDAAGATVARAAETTPGQEVSLRFADDRAGAVIQEGAGKSAAKPTKKKPAKKPAPRKSKKSDDRQGDLL